MNFNCRISENKITVTKKYFSDFFPFNFGHLGSFMLHAKSERIESQKKEIEFMIEMNDLYKFSTYGGFFILCIIAVSLLFSNKLKIGIAVLALTMIALIWSRFVYKMGKENFLKNWDEFIGSSVW